MANGKFGGGTGVSANPYLIEDAQDLNAMRFYPGSCFKLTQSINLGVYPYNTGNGWLPIDGFYGSLDGGGHKIFNLYINRPTSNYVGLFSTLTLLDNYVLQIQNLQIEEANIIGAIHVGILAGSINIAISTTAQTETVVNNCEFLGDIKGNQNVGSAVGSFTRTGSLDYNQLLFKNIFTEAHIILGASSTGYGGLIGNIGQNCTIENIISNSSVDTDVNGSSTTLNPDHWGITVSGKKLTTVNVFYNNESWTYGTSADGVNFKTVSHHTLGVFDKLKDSVGNKIWSFIKDRRAPRLISFLCKTYYVKIQDKGYCIYNFETETFETVFKKILHREQLFKNGMQTLDNIPFTAWDELRKNYDTIDIVTVLEKSGDTTFSEEYVNFEELQVNAHDDMTKKFFKQKISLKDSHDNVDIKKTIVSLKKGIVL